MYYEINLTLKKMKVRPIIKSFLFFLFLLFSYLIIGFLLNSDHKYIFIIFEILFSTVVFFIEDFKNKFLSIFYQFSFSIFILFVSILISEFHLSWIYIVFTPITYLIAINLKKTGIFKKFVFLLFLLFQNLIVSFYLLEVGIVLSIETRNSNELIDVNKNISFLKFYKKNGQIFELPKGRIVVLDFWNRNCALCFEKFPDFQELYLKYDGENVSFFYVNSIRNNETIENNIELFKKHSVAENLIFVNDNSIALSTSFALTSFP